MTDRSLNLRRGVIRHLGAIMNTTDHAILTMATSPRRSFHDYIRSMMSDMRRAYTPSAMPHQIKTDAIPADRTPLA